VAEAWAEAWAKAWAKEGKEVDWQRPVPENYQTVSLGLDFSHLAAYHIASVWRSTKALATFCGSLQETNPQKVAL